MIDLWADRTLDLGARDDVDYVLVFENRGREVGATIDHPHGQIYAYDAVPPRAVTELSRDPGPALGPDAVGDRLVAEVGGFRAWVPVAASWPFELLVAPRDQVADLPSLDRGRPGRPGPPAHRRPPAPRPALRSAHAAHAVVPPATDRRQPLAQRLAAPAHRPIAALPGTQRYVAAAELGAEVYFNPVDPSEAAARLPRRLMTGG